MIKKLAGVIVALTVLLLANFAIAQSQDVATSGSGAQSESGSQADQVSADGDPLKALLDVLQDDAARARLSEALAEIEAKADTTGEPAASPADDQAAADNGDGQGDTSSSADNAPAPDEEETTSGSDLLPTVTSEDIQSVAQVAAEVTVTFANDLKDRLTALWADVERLTSLPTALSDQKRETIAREAPLLLLTIVATVAIYRALRIFARVVIPRPKDRSWRKIIKALILQAIMRALGLLIAWVAGYGMAWTFGGGQVALAQAIYLNAFLIVGAFTFFLGLLVSHTRKDVTFSRMPAEIDAVIFRSVKRVVGLLIFTLVAVVPIARMWTSFAIAASLRSVLLTIALLMALFAIRRVHSAIQLWLRERREEEERAARHDGESSEDEFATYVVAKTEAIWNRVWPPLATLYVLVCYWIALTRPYNMVDFLAWATLHTLGALALLLISLRLLTKSDSLVLRKPSSPGEMVPAFVERVNGFLPTLGILAGLVGVVGGVIWGLSAWNLFSLNLLVAPERLWALGTALAIVLFALIFWALVSAWIDSRLNGGSSRAVSARSRTLLSLARNAFTIVVVVFGGMMALAELGINIAPLIAGAGVIGLAIGFGAQKLVQDIITGVFIQLENAINEGDVVTVAGISGAVENLTIRSVGIRDLSGTYHLVPFSAVDTVSNFMRRFSFHVEVAGIGYSNSIDDAKKAMFEAFEIVKNGQYGAFILADLEMHGVIALGESSVDIRARIKTLPGKQWDVGRAYTEQLKKTFDERGIEIPFPHRELKMPQELYSRLADMAPARALPSSDGTSPEVSDQRMSRPLGPTAGPARDDGPNGDEE